MLLALLLSAGLAFAQEQQKPSGDTYTFDFPVTLQGKSIGTVTIDAKHQTFEFAAEGLDPGQPYDLVCTQLQRSLGSAEATNTGTVRMKDKWDPWFWDGLEEAPTFVLIGPKQSLSCSIPTVLTPTWFNWYIYEKVEGYLRTQAGTPIAGVQVRIVEQYLPPFVVMPYTGTWYATTDSTGYFHYTRLFTISAAEDMAVPTVYFDGYGSYCPSYARAIVTP